MPDGVAPPGDHFATQVIQCREKGHCSMSVVIVSDRPEIALAQGQAGLAPLQRLTLAFLIAAKHYRIVWRVEINSDDVQELSFEFVRHTTI